MRVAERAACWPFEVGESKAGMPFAVSRRAHSMVRRRERLCSCVGIGALVGSIGVWEVGVVVVVGARLRYGCEVGATTAPTSRVSIMIGVGMGTTTASTSRIGVMVSMGMSRGCATAMGICCASMVRAQYGDVVVACHVSVVMLLSAIIVECERVHSRSVRDVRFKISLSPGRDDANLI